MSTGLECEFIRTPQDTWYYALQDWACPAGADDWRDYATAYGPFATQEAAEEHLRRCHANPGGYQVDDNKDNKPLDSVWSQLVKHAGDPAKRSVSW